MKRSNKKFLMRAREKYGISIVKMPMDGGFMLAIYDKEGHQVFREVRNESSETAYNMMYPKARDAVAEYFNLYKETIVNGITYRQSFID